MDRAGPSKTGLISRPSTYIAIILYEAYLLSVTIIYVKQWLSVY